MSRYTLASTVNYMTKRASLQVNPLRLHLANICFALHCKATIPSSLHFHQAHL
ncbi:hypothetical protein [Solibacillus ferritrahens]|uniref:hypothetical protein n=1 Tax=Solibacillus ferritrahens TaxID=3098620 RepID=UPI0030090CC3